MPKRSYEAHKKNNNNFIGDKKIDDNVLKIFTVFLRGHFRPTVVHSDHDGDHQLLDLVHFDTFDAWVVVVELEPVGIVDETVVAEIAVVAAAGTVVVEVHQIAAAVAEDVRNVKNCLKNKEKSRLF